MMHDTAHKQPDQTRIVALLAKESHQPVADVAKLYEHERGELALGAHVTKFLHIFATRNVQAILNRRATDNPEGWASANPIQARPRSQLQSSLDMQAARPIVERR